MVPASGETGTQMVTPPEGADKVAETATEETGATGGIEITVEGLSQQESAAAVQNLLAFARTHSMTTPRRVGLPT